MLNEIIKVVFVVDLRQAGGPAFFNNIQSASVGCLAPSYQFLLNLRVNQEREKCPATMNTMSWNRCLSKILISFKGSKKIKFNTISDAKYYW